jgi:hypothetical protein
MMMGVLLATPRALHELKSERLEAQRMQRSGYPFITEYRTTVHEQMGRFTLARSIVITLGKAQSYGLDAPSYAQARLQLWQEVRRDAALSERNGRFARSRFVTITLSAAAGSGRCRANRAAALCAAGTLEQPQCLARAGFAAGHRARLVASPLDRIAIY